MNHPNRSSRQQHSNQAIHRSVKALLRRSTHHSSNSNYPHSAHPRIKDRISTLLVREGLLNNNKGLLNSHTSNDMLLLRHNKGLPNSSTDLMDNLQGMDHRDSITVRVHHRKDMDNTEAHPGTEGLHSQKSQARGQSFQRASKKER